MPLPETLQALPQAPQLDVLAREVSQPLSATPSQSPLPLWQLHAQRPAAHRAVALGLAAQAFPHAPQWSTEARVSTHAPSQEVCPLAQVTVHAPPAQTPPLAQRRPHIPQFAGSVCRS